VIAKPASDFFSRRAILVAPVGALVATLLICASSRLRAQQFTTLYTFSSNNFNGVGYGPVGGLTLVGNTLYGTTAGGGGNVNTAGYGTIFSYNLATSAESTLHSFLDGTSDGLSPMGTLTLVNGTLYGTTAGGGPNNYGTVYSYNPATGNESVLYSFSSQDPSGSTPLAGLTSNGTLLYGTTSADGPADSGGVFIYDTATGVETTLHSFSYAGNDGVVPVAGVALVGNTLYGTTEYGQAVNGFGTIFGYNLGTGQEAVLHDFDTTNGIAFSTADGAEPVSNLTQVGNILYGMTMSGGANNNGAIFSYNVATGIETIVHSFTAATDGFPYQNENVVQLVQAQGDQETNQVPEGALTRVGDTLYGTATSGGANGAGTLYSYDLATGAFSVLHNFGLSNQPTASSSPVSGLTLVGSTLYGTTLSTGTTGTIFSFSVPAETQSSPLGVGANGQVSLNGGSTIAGGSDITLPNVNGAGTFSSTYQSEGSQAALQTALGAAYNGMNFGLAGTDSNGVVLPNSAVQFWDLNFTGTFTGDATVTLHYDPTLTGNAPTSEFQIWHYTGGGWNPVANEVVNPILDTITFTTDSFSPFLLGFINGPDANHDGIVNGQDISLVASHWLQSGSGIAGDANGDGVVNGQDIALIASNWLQSFGGGGGSAVPEPSTLVLAALGLALLAWRRRRPRSDG
jgi:uncharacterized repeat protein (TIGR03803 family)